MNLDKRYQIMAYCKLHSEAIISLLQPLFRHRKCANNCKRISAGITILMKCTVGVLGEGGVGGCRCEWVLVCLNVYLGVHVIHYAYTYTD